MYDEVEGGVTRMGGGEFGGREELRRRRSVEEWEELVDGARGGASSG